MKDKIVYEYRMGEFLVKDNFDPNIVYSDEVWTEPDYPEDEEGITWDDHLVVHVNESTGEFCLQIILGAYGPHYWVLCDFPSYLHFMNHQAPGLFVSDKAVQAKRLDAMLTKFFDGLHVHSMTPEEFSSVAQDFH